MVLWTRKGKLGARLTVGKTNVRFREKKKVLMPAFRDLADITGVETWNGGAKSPGVCGGNSGKLHGLNLSLHKHI